MNRKFSEGGCWGGSLVELLSIGYACGHKGSGLVENSKIG